MVSPVRSLDAEFERVAKAFRANLRSDELQCFKLSELGDLRTILASIEEQQDKKRGLAYMKRVEPFINTMLEFGKIVEVFLNVTDVLAFVWVS